MLKKPLFWIIVGVVVVVIVMTILHFTMHSDADHAKHSSHSSMTVPQTKSPSTNLLGWRGRAGETAHSFSPGPVR